MIVYGSSVSPFVRKVLAYAAEKGIALENGPGGGPNPDADFLAASPFRKIPAFRDGDFSICDSTAIIAYLEKLHPEPAMFPSEARSYARTIWFEEFADTILAPAAIAIFFNRVLARRFGREPDLQAADRAEREQLPRIFDYLEGVIPPSNFLVGDRLTLADISVTSFFVNLGYTDIRPDPATHPRLAAYLTAILERPSFARLIEADNAQLAPAAA